MDHIWTKCGLLHMDIHILWTIYGHPYFMDVEYFFTQFGEMVPVNG